MTETSKVPFDDRGVHWPFGYNVLLQLDESRRYGSRFKCAGRVSEKDLETRVRKYTVRLNSAESE